MISDDRNHAQKHEHIGKNTADARADQSQRRQTKLTKNQDIVECRVGKNAHYAHHERPHGLLQRRQEITCDNQPQKWQDRPHIGPHIALRFGRKLGLLTKRQQHCLRLPQDQPDRNHDRNRDPQSLPECAADIAHRMGLCAALARHHRRCRGNETHAENRRRHTQVEPQ